MTLSWVEQNDPVLRTSIVRIRSLFANVRIGYYWPSDCVDLARLGDAIGCNTNLRRSLFDNVRIGYYWPSDSVDLARVGDATGCNTN